MTKKLLVIIALGAVLAIAAAGTATSITIGTGDIQVDTGNTGVLPACADLSDNDGDGLVDLGDPGCSSAVDGDEYNAPTPSGSDSGGSGSTGGGSSGGTTTTTTTTGSSGGGASGGSIKVSGTGGKRGGTQGLFGKQAKKGQGAKDIQKVEKGKIEQPTLRNP